MNKHSIKLILVKVCIRMRHNKIWKIEFELVLKIVIEFDSIKFLVIKVESVKSEHKSSRELVETSSQPHILLRLANITINCIIAFHSFGSRQREQSFINWFRSLDLQLQIIEYLRVFSSLSTGSACFIPYTRSSEQRPHIFIVLSSNQGSLNCIEDYSHRLLNVLLLHVLSILPTESFV